MVYGLGEERELSSFVSVYENDVKKFLKVKAINFAKQDMSQTGNPQKMNGNIKKRIKNFGQYDRGKNGYRINSYLIGQFGKNFQEGGSWLYNWF